MANREACELYIEQQIDEGLCDGKNPTAIGKMISDWVGKTFETYINPRTIEQRARRKDATNVANAQTSEKTQETPNLKKLEKPKHGGKREGSGRMSAETKREIKEHNEHVEAVAMEGAKVNSVDVITDSNPCVYGTPEQTKADAHQDIFTQGFVDAAGEMLEQLQTAKNNKWKTTSKVYAVHWVQQFNNLLM